MLIVIGLILSAVTIALLFVILLGVFYAIDVFLELPYVASKKDKVSTIIELAQIKKGETIVDLGSGDGRLLFKAVEKEAFAIGYEINPFLILLTIIRSQLKGVAGHVEIYKKSLWRADLKVADIVFVYGRKKTMKKFEDFVYKNAQAGTRIIVNTNPFPDKKPVKSKNNTFVYKI